MIELDKRIIEGKKPLTCFEANQAKFFVGEKCYLTNDISIFSNLDQFIEKEGCSNVTYAGVIDTLTNIGTEVSMVFETTYLRWKFCIPCEWVKSEEPEKKYRPYTMSEFKSEFKINTILTLRKRNEDKYVYQTVYLGNRHYDDTDSDENFIYLSHGTYSLKELFEKFEIVRNGDWQPFGIIDESQE